MPYLMKIIYAKSTKENWVQVDEYGFVDTGLRCVSETSKLKIISRFNS